MPQRPIIGIPTQTLHAIEGIPEELPESWVMNQRYSRAVAAAGGLPVMIPLLDDEETLRALYDRLDGLLLPGGVDMDPSHLRRAPPARSAAAWIRPVTGWQPQFARWAITEGKPLFGLCRGLQSRQRGPGRNPHQDIASQIQRRDQHDYFPPQVHPCESSRPRIAVSPGSRLAALLERRRSKSTA